MANETITAKTADKIREKAESNTPLMDATPEKQQMYDAYQSEYKNKITAKAQSGEQLMRPNAWKDEIYAGAQQQQMYQQVQQQQQQYSPQNIMDRQQGGNAERMAQLQQMLQQGADATYNSQKSQLDATLNQQLTDLQAALEEAVANGEMSIRDAHAAFEENKGSIEQQAYNDSESTKLQAQDRGIQNSQQMLGLQQGDNARTNSLINKNMTERDKRVSDVKDRLNQLKNTSKLQSASATAQHGYGLAGAKGAADAQMYQNQFSMGLEDYKLDRDQQFQLDKSGMDQANQMQMQQQQQVYALQQLTTQQKYSLEQFAVQYGYDLSKMGVDQAYKLAQMASQNGYDMGILNQQQGFQGGQNALDRDHASNMQGMQQWWQSGENSADRDHSWNMQDSQQGWQSGENSVNRDHDAFMQSNGFQHDQSMLTSKQMADSAAMESAMAQELASYTDKGSDAYKLREAQLKSSIEAVTFESNAKLMADYGGKWLTSKVESAPVHPGKSASKAKIDTYNAQVNAYNASISEFFSKPTNADTFLLKVDNGPYDAKKNKTTKNWFNQWLTNMSSMMPVGFP